MEISNKVVANAVAASAVARNAVEVEISPGYAARAQYAMKDAARGVSGVRISGTNTLSCPDDDAADDVIEIIKMAGIPASEVWTNSRRVARNADIYSLVKQEFKAQYPYKDFGIDMKMTPDGKFKIWEVGSTHGPNDSSGVDWKRIAAKVKSALGGQISSIAATPYNNGVEGVMAKNAVATNAIDEKTVVKRMEAIYRQLEALLRDVKGGDIDLRTRFSQPINDAMNSLDYA